MILVEASHAHFCRLTVNCQFLPLSSNFLDEKCDDENYLFLFKLTIESNNTELFNSSV
jgi:hypothetical protein